jgi:colanic acid biosynthesis glycosyl transferase WcaI
MKILICSINFHPELIGIGKYTGEMASWLSSRGHNVRVVTAPPYYPGWSLSNEFLNWFWTLSVWQGVVIWRCPIWVPKKPNGLKRILHLLSFALSSFPVMIAHIFWRPDVVLAIEPPLFSAPTALLVARISGAKSTIHIQDYEVDAAFDMGILKGALLRSLILKFEKYLLLKCNLVTTISNKMLEKARVKMGNSGSVELFPNWIKITNAPRTNNDEHTNLNSNYYRDSFKFPRDAVIAMYSGNMGEKQGLEILAEVARLSQLDEFLVDRLFFVFCGNGAGRDKFERLCKGLPNIQFLDLRPANEFEDFLSIADIHLLPQRLDASDLVMPSKLAGILASGRCVLACTNPGTELALVVEGRGMITYPEDAKSFLEALRLLVNNEALRLRLGSAGKDFALKNLDMESILLNFEIKLNELINHRQ